MSWILYGLCHGMPFWKNNVRSGWRPDLEISLITSCAFFFFWSKTYIIEQYIHLLSLSVSGIHSVVFNVGLSPGRPFGCGPKVMILVAKPSVVLLEAEPTR